MTSGNVVLCQQENGVATITINRPESLNALNEEVLRSLSAQLDELAAKSFASLRAVVLRGAGEKAFVAGADIKLMQQASVSELRSFIALGQSVMRQIEMSKVPVVAAVDGFAIGGGLELALACDIIVASTKAKLGQAEVNLGLIPGFGGTQRLALRAGLGSARRLILTGETIAAEEAFRLGVVDYLVEPEKFDATLAEVVATLCSKSPFALAAAKRATEELFASPKRGGLTAEVEEFVQLFHYEDTKEGLLAFLEKRKPQFRGEG